MYLEHMWSNGYTRNGNRSSHWLSLDRQFPSPGLNIGSIQGARISTASSEQLENHSRSNPYAAHHPKLCIIGPVNISQMSAEKLEDVLTEHRQHILAHTSKGRLQDSLDQASPSYVHQIQNQRRQKVPVKEKVINSSKFERGQ